MPKKELSSKKKRLQATRAQVGEPENIFAVESELTEIAPAPEDAQVEKTEEANEKVVVRKAKTVGKKIRQSRDLVDSTKEYEIAEAIKLLKKVSYTSFVGTVELHVVSKEKGLQGTVTLPHGTGKEVRIAAIVPDETIAKSAKEAGAEHAGAKELSDQILTGKLRPGKDFDAVVAHPQAMVYVTPLAKILGPKKMMPNPKNSTVGTDIPALVKELKTGKLTYKAEQVNPYVVHMIAGKLSFENAKLEENIQIILQNLGLNKVKKVYLTSTMAPSITVKTS
jgi:large subunit ribosomal protein L1